MPPIYAHRLDPDHLYDRADDIGEMLVQGTATADDVRAWIAAQAKANAQNPEHHLGLQTRLTWAVREAADAREMKIRETERAIKRAIVPMLTAGRPRNFIMAQLHDINGAAGFPLSEQDVADIAQAAVRWFLKDRQNGR